MHVSSILVRGPGAQVAWCRLVSMGWAQTGWAKALLSWVLEPGAADRLVASRGDLASRITRGGTVQPWWVLCKPELWRNRKCKEKVWEGEKLQKRAWGSWPVPTAEQSFQRFGSCGWALWTCLDSRIILTLTVSQLCLCIGAGVSLQGTWFLFLFVCFLSSLGESLFFIFPHPK